MNKPKKKKFRFELIRTFEEVANFTATCYTEEEARVLVQVALNEGEIQFVIEEDQNPTFAVMDCYEEDAEPEEEFVSAHP